MYRTYNTPMYMLVVVVVSMTDFVFSLYYNIHDGKKNSAVFVYLNYNVI